MNPEDPKSKMGSSSQQLAAYGTSRRSGERNWRVIGLGLALLVILASVALFYLSQEPTYAGRPIRSWVRQDLYDRSCHPQVIGAMKEFPEETAKVLAQVLRENLEREGKGRKRAREWLWHLQQRIQMRLLTPLDPTTVSTYFQDGAREGLNLALVVPG